MLNVEFLKTINVLFMRKINTETLMLFTKKDMSKIVYLINTCNM